MIAYLLKRVSTALYHGRMNSKLWLRMVIVSCLILTIFFLYFPYTFKLSTQSNLLTVHFLNVGQGDAIHIMTPDGYELLVDGGQTSAVLRELATDRSFFDRIIDVVIATHPDADHIGGLIDVFKRFAVGIIFETHTQNDSPTAAAYNLAVQNEGAKVIEARTGQILQLGASTTVRILSPQESNIDNSSNSSSIIIQIDYGDIEFLLTGDAPASIEDYLVGVFGADLKSEVLKLGHHGSKTSTSELFLDAVQPQFAIVSAAKDNRYGHPHEEVMQRVLARNIKTLHTGIDTNIIFESDGKSVWVK